MKKLFTLLACVLMALGFGTLLAACGDGGGAKSITNLTYNGETITWTSVRNAKNYKIRIDNGDERTVSQAEGTVSYRYNADGADFDFSIEAVIKSGSDKNPTYSLRFENIGQVQNLAVENGALTWDILEDAEKYEVMYNGDIVSSNVGTTTYEMKAGEFNYKVRGLKGLAESADGNIPYYSVWSNALTGTVLDAPKNLTYDSEKFTWERVNNAVSYVVKIGNEEVKVTGNYLEYPAGQEDFSVAVRAVGNPTQKMYDSKYCEAKEYTYIAPVEGLSVVDGNLKWTASENAVAYKIKINGIVQNELLKANEYAKLASGQSYRIQLLPMGKSDFYFSRWSQEITLNILRSPVVRFSDNKIQWNQVTGSAGYEVKIVKGEQVVHTSPVGEDTFVYDYAFDDAGEYLVYVKATTLGDGGVYESKYSNAYPVKRLATPSNEQIINNPLEKNQVAVTFSPSVGAKGYALLADGVEIASIKDDSTTFSVDLSKMTPKTEESVVKFQIKALGGVTSEGAVLDCKIPLEFNATKLATPQNLTINGNQITWDSVNKTSKYVLTVDGKRSELTSTYYTLTDLSGGKHSIYVQAMGNGEEVITGGFSNELSIEKLATPSSLNINDNGLLTWNMIANATAYKVILGTQNFDADTTSFDLQGYIDYIEEGKGTQISVFAIGNGSDIVDSDVSATKTISRYARPDAIKASGDNLVWNPSSVNSINCNQYKLTVVKDNGQPQTYVQTGTSYPLSNFEAGSYEVTVSAMGDNKQTLDSPQSNSYFFTKLAAVSEVKREGAQYTWEAIDGASGYEIKLSKDAQWTSIKTNSYAPKFEHEGEFEVAIRAIGSGTTLNSNVYSFKQRVSALTQPAEDATMTNVNAFKVEKNGNQLLVTVKKLSGATGYKVLIGGAARDTVINETDTEIVYEHIMTTSGGNYNVQVQYLGGQFDSYGNFKIDSNLSTIVKVTN